MSSSSTSNPVAGLTLRYGSLLAYSPRGRSKTSRDSQKVRNAVKRWDPRLEPKLVERLASVYVGSGLEEFIGPDSQLVPVPRSSVTVENPFAKDAPLWPSLLICQVLDRAGYGAGIHAGIARAQSVRSSSLSPNNRPRAADHYRTLAVRDPMMFGAKVTLVDDFVTRGCTLAGAAARAREELWGVEVRAFSLVRTRGLVPNVDKILDPVVGQITTNMFGDCDRDN